jgi:hypothetical protein
MAGIIRPNEVLRLTTIDIVIARAHDQLVRTKRCGSQETAYPCTRFLIVGWAASPPKVPRDDDHLRTGAPVEAGNHVDEAIKRVSPLRERCSRVCA